MSNEIEESKLTEIKSAPATTPMHLISLAQSQNADVAQIQQLFELQLRWEQNEAQKAYNGAVAEFKGESFKILKDGVVDFTFQGKRTYYKHETLAHIVNTVVPIMAKHGLNHSWNTVKTDKEITVSCILSHKGGHSESVTLSGPLDVGAGKNNIQAIGSTVTYLQRYTLKSILGLASADEDNDGAGVETERNPNDYLSENQIAEMTALIDELKGDRHINIATSDFCAWAGFGDLKNIPRVKYRQLIASLEKKRGAQ